jgi:cytosine deaminase
MKMIREPGAAELMHEAMSLGANVVGGIPWIEFTGDDARAHIRICFDLAKEFDKDVSMLLDDAGDPSLRTLEMTAVETIALGWHGRALAHHCRAMSLYPLPYVQRLSRILHAARMPIVTDPHTGPLHARSGSSWPRACSSASARTTFPTPITRSDATIWRKWPSSHRIFCG